MEGEYQNALVCFENIEKATLLWDIWCERLELYSHLGDSNGFNEWAKKEHSFNMTEDEVVEFVKLHFLEWRKLPLRFGFRISEV